MEEVEKKINENKKLIYFVINKYFPQLKNDQECEEIALVGLWEACEKYKIEAKIKFSTYAVTIIKYKILNYLKTQSKADTKIQLDEKFDIADNSIDSDILVLVEYRLLMNNFKPVERQIIRMLINGKSNIEIAKSLNINQSNVTRRIKTIKDKLIRN